MNEERQREMIALAAKTGLTMIETLMQLSDEDQAQILGDMMVASGQRERAVVAASAPTSACPVVGAVLDYVVPICAQCFPATESGRFFDNLTEHLQQVAAPSTPVQQDERAEKVVGWFAKVLLPIIEQDMHQPTSHKVLEASKEVFLALGKSPRAKTLAVMQATLILITSINEAFMLADNQGRTSLSRTFLYLVNGITSDLIVARLLAEPSPVIDDLSLEGAPQS